MQRKARVVTTRAKALTTPDARRVSICGAGANQEPFVTIKAEGVQVVKQEEFLPMLTKMKAQGFDVAGFTFTGEKFKSEDAVKAWLADGGYEGVVVSQTDAGFAAKSEDAVELAEGTETRAVTTDEGVTVIMAKTGKAEAEGEGAASEVQPVATKDDISDADLETDGGALNPEQNPKFKPVTITLDGHGEATKSLKALMDAMPAFEQFRAEKSADGAVLKRKSMYDVGNLASLVSSLQWVLSDLSYAQMWCDDGEDAVEGESTHQDVIDGVKGGAAWLLWALQVLVSVEVADFAEMLGLGQEENSEAIKEKAATSTETVATKHDYTDKQRKAMAGKGQAMADGSFPIANEEDLHDAVRLVGNAEDPKAAKAFVIKRAKEMGLTSALPKDWKVSAKGDALPAEGEVDLEVTEVDPSKISTDDQGPQGDKGKPKPKTKAPKKPAIEGGDGADVPEGMVGHDEDETPPNKLNTDDTNATKGKKKPAGQDGSSPDGSDTSEDNGGQADPDAEDDDAKTKSEETPNPMADAPAWAQALFSTVTKSVQELTERVDAVEGKTDAAKSEAGAAPVAQSRKSAAADGATDTRTQAQKAEVARAEKSMTELRFRNAIGI